MNISHIKNDSYSRLGDELQTLLKDSDLQVRTPRTGEFPFLLLITQNDSVAFSIVDENPESEYTSAYSHFKILYRGEHAIWKDKNLSFVVCRLKNDSSNDKFFNDIETDVYFCRKYVIFLHKNRDELISELLRLPFLPFPEGRKGGILRPPSAQSLLQGINVKAQLARQIIVPHLYSSKRILDDLLSQSHELPTVNTSTGYFEQYHVQPTESTRITKLEIEAFRAYKDHRVFDLDSDIVVLYGPNGLGKTSFFDAIDYACTGRIGRLCHKRINQSDFKDLARHLSSRSSDGLVSMEISKGNNHSIIKRTINNWSSATIDMDSCDRVSTLQFLTSAQWKESNSRIENLERLFRATHLFGQSDSELLTEFAQYSTLPPDLVNRMLALDDYASGLAKIKDTIELLDKHTLENEKYLLELDRRYKETQAKIIELPETQNTLGIGKQLLDLTTNLLGDLQKYVDFTLEISDPNLVNTREWRAITETTLSNFIDKHKRLQYLESNFNNFQVSISKVIEIANKLQGIENEINQKNNELKKQRAFLKSLSSDLEQDYKLLGQFKARIASLEELQNIQSSITNLQDSLQTLLSDLQRITNDKALISTDIQQLLPVSDNFNLQIVKLRDEIQIKTKQIQLLILIQAGYPIWKKNQNDLNNLLDAIKNLQSISNTESSNIEMIKLRIAGGQMELAKLEKENESYIQNQRDLSRLLDEIEIHVENSICPTCGFNHKSKATLIDRIHSQKKARPQHVEDLLKKCNNLKKKLKEDKTELEFLVRNYSIHIKELNEMGNKSMLLSESISQFEVVLTEVSFINDSITAAAIEEKLEIENTSLQTLQNNFRTKENELSIITKRINELKLKSSQLDEALERTNNSLSLLETQIATYKDKSSFLSLTLNLPQSELLSEIKLIKSSKEKVEIHIKTLNSQIQDTQFLFSELERKVVALSEQFNDLTKDKQKHEEVIYGYKVEADTLININKLTLDNINEQKNRVATEVEELNQLRIRCNTLEQTVDYSMRSARMAELEANKQLLIREKQSRVLEAEKFIAVKKWLMNIKDVLQDQSTNAIAHHIDAFGPLSAMIQRRLSTVYGFSEVRLASKGNKINVEVGWESKYLKPADYFSESQKQILMLSIYLANRLTQTWSGFAPILLDDPVTHFDDLNAFGFVELIRGLVNNSPRKRQFLISTCENRLFELMQKKFSTIDGGAIFYKFEGIGLNGPVVQRL